MPIRLRDDNSTAAPAIDDTISQIDDAILKDTIIESYDELEKGVPTLYEVLGLLKRIYFMPEDFSNRLVVGIVYISEEICLAKTR